MDKIIKIGIGTNNQNQVAPEMEYEAAAVASSNTFSPPVCRNMHSYAIVFTCDT